MKNMNVYTIVDKIPKNANLVSSRWIFKYKKDGEGNIIQRKARLVARGFTQQFGVDYKETFSPTLRQDSFRLITVIAAQNNFTIKQMDVNAAYLNAELSEEIFMKSPEGFQDKIKIYWKLNKVLYGLKQSGNQVK